VVGENVRKRERNRDRLKNEEERCKEKWTDFLRRNFITLIQKINMKNFCKNIKFDRVNKVRGNIQYATSFW
jgi:hypothetical protein